MVNWDCQSYRGQQDAPPYPWPSLSLVPLGFLERLLFGMYPSGFPSILIGWLSVRPSCYEVHFHVPVTYEQRTILFIFPFLSDILKTEAQTFCMRSQKNRRALGWVKYEKRLKRTFKIFTKTSSTIGQQDGPEVVNKNLNVGLFSPRCLPSCC